MKGRDIHGSRPAMGLAALLLLLLLAGGGPAQNRAEEPAKPAVPSSPFLGIVYRYADTMLEKGRDQHGPRKTGLFLSALDRSGPAPLSRRPPAPGGILESARAGPGSGALVGANPHHDQNLLRVLYTLSDLSGKPTYREAADSALAWFLQNAPSPATHLLPWGERLSWDTLKDEPVLADGSRAGTHEFFRPWVLWDRSFDLAPEASARYALALWEHSSAGALKDESDRHAGFVIRIWAVAHARTKDERFLKAIGALLDRHEKDRQPRAGLRPAQDGEGPSPAASALSLAIDCGGAAHRVPEPLASRLRAFAAREDEGFCTLPHDLKGSGGFVTGDDAEDGEPREGHTPLWNARRGGGTTAQVGMMCVSRYENTGRTAYRELVHAAADAYLEALPPEDVDAWPGTFGQAISLELAAWRSTARRVYIDRARELADHAVAKFFGGDALPRASLKTDHYETITGADTLALALVELHLHILYITAVRCPPNTVDR